MYFSIFKNSKLIASGVTTETFNNIGTTDTVWYFFFPDDRRLMFTLEANGAFEVYHQLPSEPTIAVIAQGKCS